MSTIARATEAWLQVLALLSWLLLLSLLCLIQLPASGDQLPHVDKLGHVLMFAAGGLCLSWRLPPQQRGFALALLCALGALLEMLQGLGGVRQAEWADLLADGLGAWLGLSLGQGLAHWRMQIARRVRA